MSDKKGGFKEDKELSELLDSALKDFEQNETSTAAPTTQSSDDPPIETLEWNEEFIAQQSKLFEEKMAAIFGGADGQEMSPEQLQMGFQRIAEAAQLAVSGAGSADTAAIDPQFTQSITDVLKGLSEGQENLQQPFSQDDIAGMFGNINLNETGDNNPFLPFMQGMMQSLLSAEVLLPSLKDLTERYPAWLEENSSKISAEDKERYEEQLKMMKEVVDELEKESPEDSQDVKNERFKIVLERMQKMQDLGQPPKELVGDIDNTIPNLPDLSAGAGTDPAQGCNMM
jgi:peroxin-19